MDTKDLYEYELNKILELKNREKQVQSKLDSLIKERETARSSLRITREARDKIRTQFRNEIKELKDEIKQLLNIKEASIKLIRTGDLGVQRKIIEEALKKQQKEIELNKEIIEKQKQKIQKLQEDYKELNKKKLTPEKISNLEETYNTLKAEKENIMEELKECRKEKEGFIKNIIKLKNEQEHELKQLKEEKQNFAIKYKNNMYQLRYKERKLKELEEQLIKNILTIKDLQNKQLINEKIDVDLNNLIVFDDNGFYINFEDELTV